MRRVPFICATAIAFLSLTASAFVTTASAQTVQVSLHDGSISPTHIEAQKGAKLQITVHNVGKQVHNFVIPSFYVFTQNLSPGSQVNVSFAPAKTGAFRYYSDKAGKPEPGMEGVLTVTS